MMKNIFKDDKTFSRKMLGVKDSEEVRLSPFLKKILGTETRGNGSEVLSFRRYYLLIGILFSILAVLCGTNEFVDNINKSNALLDLLVTLFSMVGTFFAVTFVIVVSAVRDKEDEMYKETKSKVNEVFLTVIYCIAMVLALVSEIFNGFSITLRGWSFCILVYVMAALHSFIGYYYERKLGSFDVEDEE